MDQEILQEINRLTQFLQNSQASDGSWRFCLDTGTITDAYMIILLRSMGIHDEELIRTLAQRIASKQLSDGTWKIFHDEDEGNLAATIESYYALLFSGYFRKTDERMRLARQFILLKGGLSMAPMHTKVMLALTGQYPWPNRILIPLEMILPPWWFPLNYFDLSSYARVHITPILIAANRRFALRTERTPDLSEFLLSNMESKPAAQDSSPSTSRDLCKKIMDSIQHLPGSPTQLHAMALRQAERFMLERIEPDGTLSSFFTATFLMIFALLSLGYPTKHPVIVNAVTGVRSLICDTGGQIFVQNCTSTVWDTSLMANSLLSAGISGASPTIRKASQYLLIRQHWKYGDWSLKSPGTLPGGWGFSDINTLVPDVDDTTAALRVIGRMTGAEGMAPAYTQAWNRGMHWLLSMQNTDGGWPAFEKHTNKRLLTLLPFEGAHSVATDPSTVDLTGRTLEFLGHHAGLAMNHPEVQKGVNWLLKKQEADGSWYGRWGVSYIYGTWAALTGLTAAGLSDDHTSVKKAKTWLILIQNKDGGWGESCKSDSQQAYVPLGASTPSQTAWAVDGLIAASSEPNEAIKRGLRYLIASARLQDWTTTYPTGAGLPGGFYFQYPGYRYTWPLLALAHYKNKYLNK